MTDTSHLTIELLQEALETNCFHFTHRECATQLLAAMQREKQLLEALHMITGEETSKAMRDRAEIAIQVTHDARNDYSVTSQKVMPYESETEK